MSAITLTIHCGISSFENYMHMSKETLSTVDGSRGTFTIAAENDGALDIIVVPTRIDE